MPRTARAAPGGMVFHVINRGVGKQTGKTEKALIGPVPIYSGLKVLAFGKHFANTSRRCSNESNNKFLLITLLRL